MKPMTPEQIREDFYGRMREQDNSVMQSRGKPTIEAAMNAISAEWNDKPCDIKASLLYLADRFENEVFETEPKPLIDIMREQCYPKSTIAGFEQICERDGIDPRSQTIPVVVRQYDKRTGKPFEPMAK